MSLSSEAYRQALVRDGERRYREWHQNYPLPQHEIIHNFWPVNPPKRMSTNPHYSNL